MDFGETRLEKVDRCLRLLDRSGKILLELKGHEIDDAIRDGFVNPADYHTSMYEYARIISETDDAFMDNFGIH